MFNASWGVMVEVPLTNRYFRTEEDLGSPAAFEHTAFDDIRLMGVYSGFSEDMSSGVVFGVKLPTGDSAYANFDPDTEIGSGSTDLLLGGYHTGSLNTEQSFGYFAQGLWQHELSIQGAYRPGAELNGAVGVSYNNFMIGSVHVAPIFQAIVSNRGRDGGLDGDAESTGYTRLILSPGFEIDRGNWKAYADVELPVYQHMNGNQLVAPAAVKLILSRSF